MKKEKEHNTDDLSPERIWLRKEVALFWFDSNNSKKTNTIEETIAFLHEAAAKAKEEGFVDVVVTPSYEDGGEDTLGNSYIYVEGLRLETNDEYKRRLEWNLSRIKVARDSWEQRKTYYEANGDIQREQELRDALLMIKDMGKD